MDNQDDVTLNPHGDSLWWPPHTGVPEIVGPQSPPPRWTWSKLISKHGIWVRLI